MELYRAAPKDIMFLDFGTSDFDSTVTMGPAVVNRQFWKRMFEVAVDDLAELRAPAKIVFCEGRKEFGSTIRTPTFDASVYRMIFGTTHPDTEFVPLGSTSEIDKDALLVGGVLSNMFPTMQTWKLFDLDDRSALEVVELQKSGTRVLGRRDLESYLWDDEVITKLATAHRVPSEAATLISERQRLLSGLASQRRPANDIKSISGPLYNEAKRRLNLTGCGNTAVEFARSTLAIFVTPDTAVFKELEKVVFP